MRSPERAPSPRRTRGGSTRGASRHRGGGDTAPGGARRCSRATRPTWGGLCHAEPCRAEPCWLLRPAGSSEDPRNRARCGCERAQGQGGTRAEGLPRSRERRLAGRLSAGFSQPFDVPKPGHCFVHAEFKRAWKSPSGSVGPRASGLAAAPCPPNSLLQAQLGKVRARSGCL